MRVAILFLHEGDTEPELREIEWLYLHSAITAKDGLVTLLRARDFTDATGGVLKDFAMKRIKGWTDLGKGQGR